MLFSTSLSFICLSDPGNSISALVAARKSQCPIVTKIESTREQPNKTSTQPNTSNSQIVISGSCVRARLLYSYKHIYPYNNYN